ncbi:MAG: hypothetical protein JW953_04875 [Anaerolineae bacterium]|nr:hypothetical protein [Anaerolineae bacterium]
MKTGKVVQILSSLLFILIGMFCCVGSSIVTLSRDDASIELFNISIGLGQRTAGDFNCFWLVLVFIPIMFIETGLWWNRRSWEMKTDEMALTDNAWSKFARQFARYQGIKDLLLNIAGLFVLSFALPAITIALIWLGIKGQLALSIPFVMIAVVFTGYLLLRFPLILVWQQLGLDKRTTKLLRWRQPKYELLHEGVMIDPAIPPPIGGKQYRRDYKFQVGFAEIDEIREFSSYPEAQTFMAYSVGPNLNLAVRQTKDMARFVKGEIDRPRVYVQRSGVGKIVLLRGSELFYLLGFDTDDVSDLLRAFQQFKSR